MTSIMLLLTAIIGLLIVILFAIINIIENMDAIIKIITSKESEAK